MGRISRPTLTSCDMLVTPSVVLAGRLFERAVPISSGSASASLAFPIDCRSPKSICSHSLSSARCSPPEIAVFRGLRAHDSICPHRSFENRDPSEADSGEGQDQYQEASELGVRQLAATC